MARVRLDKLLVDRGLVESRQRASALIRAGSVLVDNMPKDKPGTQVSTDVEVRLKDNPLPYVGRGGLKLEAALDAFNIDPTGLTCADLGASTGGFTDCLLQRGAERVFAIDVGYGQLAWKLRNDERVVVMERTNARHLESLPAPISLIVGDLSFISLTLILPTIIRLSESDTEAVLLIKPQFEVGRDAVGKGGVVRDHATRSQAIDKIKDHAQQTGCTVLGVIDSPVPGAKKGNVEALIHLKINPS
jgi:23S rRNA (cytidine1920-2'-O)/16S rRNA (cytidine1409-2'-O)-methyltransferase